MEKKNKNRFCIQFNPVDKMQEFTVDVLNGLQHRSIALYIAQAVYAYENRNRNIEAVPIISNTETRKNIQSVNAKEADALPVAQTSETKTDPNIQPLSHTKNTRTENTGKNPKEQEIIIVPNNDMFQEDSSELNPALMESLKGLLGG